jgi:hypothetical protein
MPYVFVSSFWPLKLTSVFLYSFLILLCFLGTYWIKYYLSYFSFLLCQECFSLRKVFTSTLLSILEMGKILWWCFVDNKKFVCVVWYILFSNDYMQHQQFMLNFLILSQTCWRKISLKIHAHQFCKWNWMMTIKNEVILEKLNGDWFWTTLRHKT